MRELIQQAPQLGQRHGVFARRLGHPIHVGALTGCVVRRYPWDAGVLTVLFHDGKSIALHCPYPTSAAGIQALPSVVSEFRPADPACSKLACGSTGWLIALRTCPRTFIDALEQVSPPPRA